MNINLQKNFQQAEYTDCLKHLPGLIFLQAHHTSQLDDEIFPGLANIFALLQLLKTLSVAWLEAQKPVFQ